MLAWASQITLKEEFRMASLDWSQCPSVESKPGKVSGAWVFRGTREQVEVSSPVRRAQRTTASRLDADLV
jgi:hypothetical protein